MDKQVNILVPMMNGFEEIELTSIVDILRRGGLEVVIASNTAKVKGAHNIIIESECLFKDININEFDAIALAGGYEGMLNLSNEDFIIQTLQTFNKEHKLIAAICASPIVLDKAKVLKNKFTCYPSCENSISSNAIYTKEIVVVDDNIITSIGPASASIFAIEILKYLTSTINANKITEELLLDKCK
ncbi:DJ-1 family glyoxalase III [Helicobacter sp. MIT 14-3879]|uniref:DJ-1 family glyoxalase III n=1 Tax=Helicobacter sp. MIT 14-3879 TaxID=2040649 RepID=UPI000E1E9986|nr:DJ-1 family glyoxalase III [Helicobacter sp. MIT 14-3879]RDU63471.1 DJ-1 family protein [Helicobacter sp. MIT 14-3879]